MRSKKPGTTVTTRRVFNGNRTVTLPMRFARRSGSILLQTNRLNPMKTTNHYIKIALLSLAAAVMFTVASARADTYSSTNFQSDIPGVAPHTDPNLVNPWGMAAGQPVSFGSATTAPASPPCTIRMAQPFRW